MAPTKHHAPWQCSQSICSQVQPNTFKKPSVFLVAPIDHYGHVFVQIEQIQALLDTGASISCISQHILHKTYKNPELSSSTYKNILGVCGEVHLVLGTVNLSFTIDDYAFEHTFHVFSKLHKPIIIGRDFMNKEKIQLDFRTDSITVQQDLGHVFFDCPYA